MKPYQSFKEFYPFYLSQHTNLICRRLHVLGELCALSCLFYAVASQHWWLILVAPILGYGFAWLGHFGFEKNKPATFEYPLYSFLGDWMMLKDYILGRIER